MIFLYNNDLESSKVIDVGWASAGGVVGTKYTEYKIKDKEIYLVLMRPGNDNNGWIVAPILSSVAYNTYYISIGTDGRIGLIFRDTWGYGCIVRIKTILDH